MKKPILHIGKVLNRTQQKQINGGDPPCFEWCADPALQEIYWKPYNCNCNSGGSGGSGGTGGPGNGEPV